MDPDALGRLLDRHEAALILYARQLCEVPEDVVPEAFLRIAALDSAPEKPGAWLFRAVRNLALDAALSAGRRRKYEMRAAVESTSWFEPEAASPDTRDPAEAEAALRELRLEEREAIVAHIWGGLTFEQIARAAGTSSSTAHRLYMRGLQSLRESQGAPCPIRKTKN